MGRKETSAEEKEKAVWLDEPDYIEFVHQGYQCEVKRVSDVSTMGHLCGYVTCQTQTEYQRYDEYQVHGGITFNEDKTLKIGFDCAHAGDLSPGLGYRGQYRDIGFVIHEICQLVRQIKRQ